MNGAALARAHGASNVVGGLWPLVSLRSFEAVFGPKVDRWLVHTVSGLLLANGLVQLAAARTPDGIRSARHVGLGTAAALAAVDLVYVPKGRIRWTYLLDAAIELGWITAWLREPARTPGPA